MNMIRRNALFLEWMVVWFLVCVLDAGFAKWLDFERATSTQNLIMALGIVALPRLQKLTSPKETTDDE